MAVSLDQAIQQIVQLGEAITKLKKDVQDLQGENVDLRSRFRDQAAGQAGQGNRQEKSELRSLKAVYPDKFNLKEDVFKAWSEDFERWLKAEDENLSEALHKVIGQETNATIPDNIDSENVRFAYSHLRKLMGNKEAKFIARVTRGDNVFKAYRFPHRRYNPRTAAQKSNRLRVCTKFGINHKDTKISDVPQTIIDFEKVVQEYRDDYGTYCLTEDTCKDALRQIIPKPLECAINLATVGISDKDITYQRLKDVILEYALDNDGKAPMSIRASFFLLKKKTR